MDQTARLSDLISRYAADGLTQTMLPGISLLRAQETTEPLGEIAEPAVAIIAQGVKETALNGRVFPHGPGQFAVIPAELPVNGRVTQASPAEPLLAVVLSLRQQHIIELLAEMSQTLMRTSGPRAVHGIAVSDASPELIDAVCRLLTPLGQPDAVAVLAPGAEREILWRLLTGPQGPTVREIAFADSQLAHLARAITWIRGHYDQTLRIEGLAAMTMMSVTSFHRHFRALTSMTPVQFQKQIRLHEARNRLLANPEDVAGAGYAAGYSSPSQFSREYRRQFGATPSRHALALRQEPQALHGEET